MKEELKYHFYAELLDNIDQLPYSFLYSTKSNLDAELDEINKGETEPYHAYKNLLKGPNFIIVAVVNGDEFIYYKVYNTDSFY